MKQFLALLVTFLATLNLSAEDRSYDDIDISKGWKFKLGDDPDWSQPELDESEWKSIEVGKPWEEQGYADSDGYGWYRLHVRLPQDYKTHADMIKHGFLRLSLGKIDDLDQAWWNGRLIGETGNMEGPYTTKWSVDRTYTIPREAIRWEKDNVLAVRVYDGTDDGGLYEGPYTLRIGSWHDLVNLKIATGTDDGIFRDPDGLPLSLHITNESSAAMDGKLNWSIETDDSELIKSEESDFSALGQDYQIANCTFRPTEPGFYRIHCKLQDRTEPGISQTSLILGYCPEKIKTRLTREDDFAEFWKQTLTELSKVAPEFKMTHRPHLDTKTHEVFEVSMRSLGNVRVCGWYERPRNRDKAPALLRVPGYTEVMRPTGTSDPWAVFSFNIRAHGNSQQDVSGTPEDYWLRGLDDKATYFYRGAYADCVRAIDFLASREEVDMERIAVTGGSQGGGLSLATAALDQRISLCAPDIPFLCNWERYFKTTSWPEIQEWIDSKPNRSWDKTLRTLSYFDNLNLADRIQCPVLLGVGLQDEVCSAVSIFAVYNKISAPKQYRVYLDAGHWVDASHHVLRRTWMMQHFGLRE